MNSVSYAESTTKKKKQILVLNSYHHGIKWTDDIEKGIKTVFKNNKEVDLHFDYMDTKRNSSPDYIEKIHKLLEYKYKNKKFDGIIVSDDDAYNFILQYHEKIFSKTPVVFCGVNDFKLPSENSREFFTGAIKTIDIKNTIEVALDIHSETKNIIVISDNTTTGKAMKRYVKEIIPQFDDKIDFTFLENIDMSKIRGRVSRLSEDSIILLMIFNVDKSNKVFSYQESTELISEKANVPVYGVADVQLGHGIVGGILTNGESQGEVAGKLMADILNGKNSKDIAKIKENFNKYMFDYIQLEEFGIDLNKLPKGSYIINKPTPLWIKYKRIFILGMFFLFIILLGINIRKSQSEKRLKIHATTDELTGILNRRAGLELLEKQIKRSDNGNAEFKVSICFIDVNGLKFVNDKYGHHEGDMLIKDTCIIIKNSIRDSDVFCRLGGDEFLIIFPKSDIEIAKNVLKIIDKEIENYNMKKRQVYKISISRGYSEFNSKSPVDIDTLIKIADAEMYKDKKIRKSLEF